MAALIKDKIYSSHQDILAQVTSWKRAGKKIVFTNGCFDLLHMGHVLYLEQASTLADVLVVGLNDDQSVKRLKGPHRPINDVINRAHVLAALNSVTAVVIFEEDTPLNIITAIIPDVLVKGGDWAIDQIVGSDVVIRHGGSVLSLQYVEGYSTTNIETKIKFGK